MLDPANRPTSMLKGVTLLLYLLLLGWGVEAPVSPSCQPGAYDWNCCNEQEPCSQEGQGDCDTDDDCGAGLRCGADNCGPSDPTGAMDCCYSQKLGARSHASTATLTPNTATTDSSIPSTTEAEAVSTTSGPTPPPGVFCPPDSSLPGSWQCCSPSQRCGEGEGDCDHDKDCREG